MLSGIDFVVFGEDFGRNPHCGEHLMRQFLPHNRVLWVQTAGMRGPRLSFGDLKRVLEKIKAWTSTPTKNLPEGLTLLSPPMLPYLGNQNIRKWNARSVEQALSKKLKELQFHKPIFITTLPTTVDFLRPQDSSLSVYYCVDDFSLWPGFPQKTIAGLEQELIEKVGIVVATSDRLQETKSKKTASATVLSHGVDLAHFLLPLRNRGKDSPLTLGMFGLVDERVDLNLLERILDSDSTLSIKIIGTVTVKHRVFSDRRVKVVGPVPYAQLPSTLSDIDIFILPYVKNSLTETINPLKIREYLATGRPVVAMDLRELKKISKGLLLAKDSQDFIGHLRKLKGGEITHPHEEVLQSLGGSSWKARAEEFSQILIQQGHVADPRN